MAASEHLGWQNLDLADWPVWRKLIDRRGSSARGDQWPLTGSETSPTAFRQRISREDGCVATKKRQMMLSTPLASK